VLLVALSSCARLFPHRPPLESLPPEETGQAPSEAARPATAAPGRKVRPPRGEVAEAEKPEWMRGLTRPELPLRWYPRVSGYLELYRQEPRARDIMRGWLRRLDLHRPAIEGVLAREGMPRGLVFVAMIESGFTAGATSSKAAGGFWQFMPDVGRGYGLEVSFWADERRDLEKSTAAAARYLGDLRHRFGNWELALAGYNAGVFAVIDSIVRYNSNDFWTLCQVEAGLPWETTEYVPKVMAVGIVAQNRRAFGFDEVSNERPPDYDVASAPPGATFETLGEKLGVPADVLAQLNPIYVRRRTPPDRGPVPLRVPRGKGAQAVTVFASVRGMDGVPMVVRSGETVARIARARKLPVQRIRRLNGIIDDDEVTPGTTLLLPRAERGGKRRATEKVRRG
jgi:membrane-bound lytic murein transglycosylase D